MLSSAVRCSHHTTASRFLPFATSDTVQKLLANDRPNQKEAAIVRLLQMAQTQNGGYLNTGCIDAVAELTQTSPADVIAQASSHSIFRISKRKHLVECCNGSGCFVSGKLIHKVIEAATNGSFQRGYSSDGEFDLVQVGCVGECANAPWIRVDGVKYVRLDEAGIVKVLEKAKQGEDTVRELYVKPVEGEGH
jgi:NADH dehydrogenase (ubiquinone) flavoprotein 2